MKNTINISLVFLFVLVLIMSLSNSKLNAQGTGYVHLNGKQFIDEKGQPFYPLICNYTLELNYVDDPNPPFYRFVITPDHGYGKDASAEYIPDIDAAKDRLLIDFKQIKSMGFNTIRMMAILIKKKTITFDSDGNDDGNSDADYFFTRQTKYPDTWDAATMKKFQFSPRATDILQNGNFTKLLEQYNEVIEIAKTAGLYVILQPAGGMDLFKDQSEVNDYKELLIQFGMKLKTKTNILAYDLFNEPFYTDNDYQHKKEELCMWTNEIYDAMKNSTTGADPNHLITLGGHIILDVLEWDPTVLKIDFWAPHYYYKYNTYNTINYTDILSTTHNSMVWMKNNCSIPWLLGETGFVANDDEIIDNQWGSEIQQADYAQKSLEMVRNAGGSGYAWWVFQHYNWFSIPDPTKIGTFYLDKNGNSIEYTLENYQVDVHNHYQNNFGLLRAGEPVAGGVDPYPILLKKPVVDIFINYLKTPNYLPVVTENLQPNLSDYFNPYHHPVSAKTISGTVLDIKGKPIKDAVVHGWSELTSILGTYYEPHYTLTDDEGKFTLIPYSRTGYITLKIIALRISAGGYERYYAEWFPPLWATYKPLLPNATYHLNGINNSLRGNSIVNSGEVENYYAVNTLTASDLTISPGGTSEIAAPEEITLMSGFNAEKGSDVYIHNATPNIDCSFYSDFELPSLIPPPPLMSKSKGEDVENNSKEVVLVFKMKNPSMILHLQPNPSKETTIVSLLGQTDNSIKQIIVYNMLGVVVSKWMCDNINTTITLQSLPKGIYFVKALDTTKIIDTKKLIIN